MRSTSRDQHWDDVYGTRADEETSWFQARADTSLRLIRTEPVSGRSLVDVGAGTSTLWEQALDAGFADVTVLDVSKAALQRVTARLGSRSRQVHMILADVLDWEPERTFDVWHDRAVFHFLTEDSQRRRYAEAARTALRPGGLLVVGTFAADGPSQCSGLPTARYDPDALVGAVGEGFDRLHSEREEHVTPSGAVQPFSWVVLRRSHAL